MSWIRHIVVVFLLILAQVQVMNGIYMTVGVLPCIYIYYAFSLPLRMSPIALFVVSFFIGLAVDIFTDTPGVNALACLIMSYVLYLMMKGVDRSKMERNNIKYLGSAVSTPTWYIRTMVILTFVHHFVYFTLSDWSASHFIDTLFIILISAVSTIIFMLIFDVLFFKNKI